MDGKRGDDTGNTFMSIRRFGSEKRNDANESKTRQQNESGHGEKQGSFQKDGNSVKDGNEGETRGIGGDVKKEAKVTADVKKVQEEEVAENRVRVVAYSDSDSDVESHFQRVKTHLLPGIDSLDIKPDTKNKPKADEEEEEKSVDSNQTYKGASGRVINRLLQSVGGLIAKLVPGNIVYRSLALLVVHRMNPVVGQSLELGSGVLALVGIVARRGRPISDGNATLMTRTNWEIEQMAWAAVVYEAVHAMLSLVLRNRGLVRLTSGVNVDSIESGERLDLDRPPETMAEWALVYKPEMKEMRRILDECEIALPDRFQRSDAEFMRFAAASGLMEAEAPKDRAAAVEKAVRRLINTHDDFSNFEEMKENRLKRWERLVSWRGVDASGFPILVVRLGRALQLSTKSEQVTRFVQAIKTQVEVGIETKVHDDRGDRIIAVVDCGEITTWEAISNSRSITMLAKDLVKYLVANYPRRLERIYLLDVSLVSRMMISSITSTLPVDTKEKIVTASSSDESLPITLATLQKSRSFVAALSTALSDPSLATSTASTPRAEGTDEEEGEEEVEEEEEEERDSGEVQPGETGIHKEGSEQWMTPGKDLLQLEESSPDIVGQNMDDPMLDAQGVTPKSLITQGPQSHYISSVSFARDRYLSTETSFESLENVDQLKYPWMPMSLFLDFLSDAPSRLKTKDALSPSNKTTGLGFSRESSFQSIESPRRPIRGGLLELPLRLNMNIAKESPIYIPRLTPAKSSLRNDTTQASAGTSSSGILGSYPLPRQASVSWAEKLERIKEIEDDSRYENRQFARLVIETYLFALLLAARVFQSAFI